eukprot:COSAG01_NODE_4909_length_4634_cov_25.764498_2_plen_82_part_00
MAGSKLDVLAQLIASRRYYQDNFPGMGCVCRTNDKKRNRTVLMQRMSQYFALESPQMEAITAYAVRYAVAGLVHVSRAHLR